MPFTIVRQDITKMKTDAIVNAANTSLKMGGGVCGAIFSAAGADRLQSLCDELAPIKTGDAVITKGLELPAKYIIHTAGPVYRGGNQGEEALLRACYTNSLALAAEYKCESIAFPLISSGIYGYPKAEALRVAMDAICGFISTNDMDVSLVVFDKGAVSVNEELVEAVDRYIDENYFEEDTIETRVYVSAGMGLPDEHLSDLVDNLEEPFSTALLRLIDATGKKDAEIYQRANIDRRLFSKIRTDMNYTPSKPTVISFAIALELSLGQTNDLLERAGFALSHSRMFDVIVEYFIANRHYDIFRINEVLFSYDQPLLGGQ